MSSVSGRTKSHRCRPVSTYTRAYTTKSGFDNWRAGEMAQRMKCSLRKHEAKSCACKQHWRQRHPLGQAGNQTSRNDQLWAQQETASVKYKKDNFGLPHVCAQGRPHIQTCSLANLAYFMSYRLQCLRNVQGGSLAAHTHKMTSCIMLFCVLFM